METLEQIVSIASGAIGLIAGLAALFLRSRVQALPVQASSSVASGARLASYHDASALAKPRQPKHLRRFLIVGGSAFLLPAMFLLSGGDPKGLAWLAGSAIYLAAAVGAGQEHSPTFKSATLVVESPIEDVMNQSHELLRRMGLKVTAFDLSEGVIKARRTKTLLALGEIMMVSVALDDSDRTRVVVESDMPWTTSWLDFGANQRNIDDFVTGFLGH